MERFPLKVLVPMLLAVMLVLTFLALILTVAVDTLRGTPVDPAVIGAFVGLCGTLIATLAGFWASQSEPRKDPPEPPQQPPGLLEPTGDVESDEWNRRHGYLEFRRMLRWKPKPCSN